MNPEDLLRQMFARRQASDRATLERITRPKPDPDSNPLPAPDVMLASALADMERDEEDGN